MSFSPSFFSNQHSGDSSNKEIRVVPQAIVPQLTSLYATLSSHFAKLGNGAGGDTVKNSRQQLLSSYAGLVEWDELIAFCLTVYESKAILQHIATKEEFLAELEACKRYYLAAQEG